MKMFAFAIWLLLVLIGCAPKVVQVPIPVSCFKQTDIPANVPDAADSVTIDSSDGEKVKAVLIEREQLRASDGIFRALFDGCAL